jgi:hypothetical protein
LGFVIWSFSSAVCFAQRQPELRSPPPLDPVVAQREGRGLAAELLAQRPSESATNTGLLKIRNADGKPRETPVRFEVFTDATNWTSIYETMPASNGPGGLRLTIIWTENQPIQYVLSEGGDHGGTRTSGKVLTGNEAMIPFAGSDFWLTDLGREFLHWPDQRLLRKQVHRSRACQQLESINPHPVPGGYSRVVSWVDTETGGIMDAEAFDASGDLIKRFTIEGFKKVRGQWQLEGMDIRNRKTGSRTWIEFDLK